MMSYRGLCHRMPFRIMLTSKYNGKVIEGNDEIMGLSMYQAVIV